ncbi:MAG TPA: DUF6252 family protein [Chitinophagaceae bacterium]
MEKLKLAIVLFFTGLFIVSCTKEVTELPPGTQTGANTFGARVNGEFWIPEGFGVVPTAPILEARYIDKNLFINARNFSSSPNETEFEIYVENVAAPGIFLLNKNTGMYPHQSESYAYYVKRKFTPVDEWMTNSRYGGQVTITKIDFEARIVSGTFYFQAESEYTADQSINVTEGRFDVKF